MRIDVHVHTDRFSECGRSSPEAMVERAIDEGFEALVFTEHNIFWPEADLEALRRRYPAIVLLRGAEFTSPEGEDWLVYGPTGDGIEPFRQDPERLVRHVHDLGGAVVLAHPYRYHPTVPDWLFRCPVDAIEVMSSNIYEPAAKRGRALAKALGLPCVASSDGHHVDSVGWYGLELRSPVSDEDGLVRCLRNGLFSLHANHSRLKAENETLERQCRRIRALVDQDYADEAIRAAMPDEFISLTLIRGVRDGLDMTRPAGA